jgi:hypothetical protein
VDLAPLGKFVLEGPVGAMAQQAILKEVELGEEVQWALGYRGAGGDSPHHRLLAQSDQALGPGGTWVLDDLAVVDKNACRKKARIAHELKVVHISRTCELVNLNTDHPSSRSLASRF